MSQSAIIPGIYQHYKGPKYRVFEVAKHSESEEILVVYRALYGDFGLWVRPLKRATVLPSNSTLSVNIFKVKQWRASVC